MKFLMAFMLLLTTLTASASDSIPKNLILQRPDRLFAHTDKHIYSNNEYLWFSAWLLEVRQDSIPLHNLVSVMLVPADTRIPMAGQKFVMSDGFSFGSLRLPDSIAPGEYKFLAYTNCIANDSLPLAVFTQDITIHSVTEPDFVAAATMLEGTGKKDLLVTVRNKTTSAPIRDAELLFWCGNHTPVKATTDKNGVYRQAVAALASGKPSSPVVNIKIKYKQQFTFLQKIVFEGDKNRQLLVQFYPEGGQLLSGMPCRIGWRSVTNKEEPVAVKAVLFKDQIAVDTIVTNEWGMGAFMLSPEKGAAYQVKVISAPPGIQLKAYPLPAALEKGVMLRAGSAMANDTLRMQIYSAGYDSIRMVVHNFNNLFIEQAIPLKENHTPVLLLLDSIPRGIAAVTLLDNNNNRVAERIFFAHYNNPAQLSIQPNQAVYGKRQKATLQFQGPPNAIAMVSCVQANRMLNEKQQDIESFMLLQSPLQDALLSGKRYGNTNWMELLLMVKEGRTYSNVQTPSFFSPVFTGKVETARGRVKKPLTVNIIGNQAGAAVVATDATGAFTLNNNDLLVIQDRKLLITANESSTSANLVIINDPYTALNKKLAAALDFTTVDAGKYLQFAYTLFAKDLGQAKQLATVTVTARSGSGMLSFGSNSCGDYVCSYNILNCPNHPGMPGNRAPVKGKTYELKGQGMVVYWGCAQDDKNAAQLILEYDGIKIGKPFFAEDFSEKTSANPEYISTLYYAPALLFDAHGKAECSFYTSDITGRFRITVNGATGNNFFSGTAYFDVK